MSGRRFADYKALVTVVIDQVRAAGVNLSVKYVVGDFEAAVWKAVRLVVPQVDMRGCFIDVLLRPSRTVSCPGTDSS